MAHAKAQAAKAKGKLEEELKAEKEAKDVVGNIYHRVVIESPADTVDDEQMTAASLLLKMMTLRDKWMNTSFEPITDDVMLKTPVTKATALFGEGIPKLTSHQNEFAVTFENGLFRVKQIIIIIIITKQTLLLFYQI
jgi:hypothetical protein